MVRDISVQEFYDMMQAGEEYTLLDVRREDELATAAYPEPYVHIELSELPERLTEVPQDYPIIVACRSGGRSAKAAALLDHKGFRDVYNLEGGILAWTDEIEPLMREKQDV